MLLICYKYDILHEHFKFSISEFSRGGELTYLLAEMVSILFMQFKIFCLDRSFAAGLRSNMRKLSLKFPKFLEECNTLRGDFRRILNYEYNILWKVVKRAML